MAKSTRSAATERAYLHFTKVPHGVVVVPTATSPAAAAAAAGADEDFDEADIWGAFAPSAVATADPPRELPFLQDARKEAAPNGGRPAHGSLPMNIPDWSKILGSAYRPSYRHYGDWEVDDDEDSSVDAMVPPHEVVWRRRAASLSFNGFLGRTLRVRDAVWKFTTGFQD